MKKILKPVLVMMVAVLLMVSMFGCYGNMALTRKVWEWNGSLGNKVMVNVVFWVLNFVPVYSATVWIDVVILNTIEFWTGSNPLAMAPGEENIRFAEADGKKYQISTTQNRIEIKELEGPDAGKTLELLYDSNSSSWYMNDGENSIKIATMQGDKLNLIYPDGQTLAIDLATN